MYGTVRGALIVFGAILLGMVVSGNGHEAASIVSHISGAVFHFPVIAGVLFIGVLIGLWLGGDRAVDRIGEYDKQALRHKIEVGGRPLK